MSDLTKDNLDAAIAAHFADYWADGMVAGYVTQISGFTADDIDTATVSYLQVEAEHQAPHITLGLLTYAHANTKNDMTHGNSDD